MITVVRVRSIPTLTSYSSEKILWQWELGYLLTCQEDSPRGGLVTTVFTAYWHGQPAAVLGAHPGDHRAALAAEGYEAGSWDSEIRAVATRVEAARAEDSRRFDREWVHAWRAAKLVVRASGAPVCIGMVERAVEAAVTADPEYVVALAAAAYEVCEVYRQQCERSGSGHPDLARTFVHHITRVIL